MAKFCSKCGKPLEDGKPCSCESTVKTSSASQKGIGEMLKEYWELVKRVFKEPVTVVEENASEDKFNIALVSIIANGIMMGLFYCLFMKATMGALSSLVGNADLPYIKIFLVGFVAMAGLQAVMAVAGYFSFSVLFKANTSIKKMFIIVGLTSIIETVALAGCSVLSLFKLSETIIYCIYGLVAFSAILSLVYFVKGIDKYAKVDSNKLGYAIAIMYAISTIVAYLVLTNVNWSSILV